MFDNKKKKYKATHCWKDESDPSKWKNIASSWNVRGGNIPRLDIRFSIHSFSNFSHACRISKVSSTFRWKLKGENCNSFEKRIKIEDSLLDFKMYCKSDSHMCTNYLRGRKRGAWAQELKVSLVNNKTLIKKILQYYSDCKNMTSV